MSLSSTTKITLSALAAGAVTAASIVGFALANASTASATSSASAESATSATSETPRGYQVVALPNKSVPNFKRRTVLCPHPKRVIGGGGEAQGPNAVLVGSFPTQDGRGWIALGRQTKGGTVGISVYAICAN